MNDSKIVTFSQLEEITLTVCTPTFAFDSHKDAYIWINNIFNRFTYHKKGRTKKEKMLVRGYIKRYTTYSTSQITRLVREKKKTGTLKYGEGKKRHQYKKIYTPEDAKLLAEADNMYRRMSGDAMRAVFKDEYLVYGKKEYERLSNISHGQFYRLRETDTYKEKSLTVGRTISVIRPIGTRKKPRPNGRPGFVRADTVHQGDLDGVKGVYHINLVDEVTQWEILICVDSITEKSMADVLQIALLLFPFTILNFHSDHVGLQQLLWIIEVRRRKSMISTIRRMRDLSPYQMQNNI